MNIVGNIKDIISKLRINSDDEVYVCMEGLSYNSKHTRSLCDLAGLNYLIRNMLVHQCSFIVVPPAVIKKFASGNGNCKKEVIINLFLSTYPDFKILSKIDDIADSYYMAKYCEDYFG